MTSGYYGSSQVMPNLPFIHFQWKTPKCSTWDKIWQQHSWLMKSEAHIQIPILCLLAGRLTSWSQKPKPEMSMPFSLDRKLVAKVTSQAACAKLNTSETLILSVFPSSLFWAPVSVLHFNEWHTIYLFQPGLDTFPFLPLPTPCVVCPLLW